MAKKDLNDLDLMSAIREARSVSDRMYRCDPDAKAWVYLAFHREGNPRYWIRFSVRPETSIRDEPGLSLRPVASFLDGRCVMSTRPDLVEPEYFFRNMPEPS